MKEKNTKSGKKVAGIILSAVLVVGSLGTAAALAANATDAVPKNTVISALAAPSPSEAVAVTQGTILYSKDAYVCPSENLNSTIEHWYDSATKTLRSDIKEYSADLKLTRWQSSYYLNGATELIIIQRDQNGNPVSGTNTKNGKMLEIMQQKIGYSGFDSVKQVYTRDYWTNIGSVQTADGKTLLKLSDSWQKWTGDGNPTTETTYNVQEIMFIDQETGLPVKSELYEDSTGQLKLFSTDAYAYQIVADDGTLFKLPNIALTPIVEPSNAGAPAPAQTGGK
jgi:hypothetical protein